jgi:hypothetical protein
MDLSIKKGICENCEVVILKTLERNFGKKSIRKPIQTGVVQKSSKGNDSLRILRNVKPDRLEALKAEYQSKGLAKVPDRFILYRIIGNNLYPRHTKNQARKNLQFTLENETELANCEKRWIVNRIFDQQEEQAIIDLLRQSKQSFIHLPFREKDYRLIGWDLQCLPTPNYLAGEQFDVLGPEQRERLITAIFRLKNNYVMNNNGARNVALRDGKSRGKWVLPWDGNCFVTKAAWEKIYKDVTVAPYLKYFAVPMARVVDNKQLLSKKFNPEPLAEPQLIFRKDAFEEFNEEFCYGRRSKVELFWRLGIPGKWDRWHDDPWDRRRRPKSGEKRQFGVAGWTARLSSGMENLERNSIKSFKLRGETRLEAICATLRNLDLRVAGKQAGPGELAFWRSEVLKEEQKRYRAGEALPPLEQLMKEAEAALTRGPFSVTDKKTLPPSGKANDYWHPAPYWWPNPKTKNGLPYLKRDGLRVPGTQMDDPESDKYDRTRLQRVFDDSLTLALAWYFTEKKHYAEHGGRILERFFVNPATRMTPHLKYAQVRMGSHKNEGVGCGIIEMKDIYYFLDAVRLLTQAGSITTKTLTGFKDWLANYLDWLIQSPQGKHERQAMNNHGTYYDLQVAAIAGFLNQRSLLFETLIRAQSRIPLQFASDGSQPEELKRATTAHYCCFNLQGWLNIAGLASRWGTNLWTDKTSGGSSLITGANWLLSHIGKEWPYKQIDKFDTDRYLPIWIAFQENGIKLKTTTRSPKSRYAVKSRFSPHDGIRPYWNLG